MEKTNIPVMETWNCSYCSNSITFPKENQVPSGFNWIKINLYFKDVCKVPPFHRIHCPKHEKECYDEYQYVKDICEANRLKVEKADEKPIVVEKNKNGLSLVANINYYKVYSDAPEQQVDEIFLDLIDLGLDDPENLIKALQNEGCLAEMKLEIPREMMNGG